MSIIGSLPYNLTNGQVADATQVMADFNAVVNAVNNSTTGAASIPSVQAGTYNYAADTGTVNAIIVGLAVSPSVYTDGLQGNTKAANTNTSTTVTIRYGSLGTKALVIDQAGTLPPIGCYIAGMHYRTEYDSTQDKVILLNPSRATFSYTGTMTGITTTVTGTITGATAPDGVTKTFSVPQGFTGTSNTTACTITGGPTAMQAATAQAWPVPVTDNGVVAMGNMFIAAASGTISFGNQLVLGAGGSFTASGTKIVPRLQASTEFTVTYVSTP